MYTFREQCAEVPELLLEDGTSKIFLNVMSRNGRAELVSLLQYMKHTTLENADISVMDKRILHLDSIVEEVKQTEEWEVVRLKNHTDVLIFQLRVCVGATNSKLQSQI